MSAVTSKTYTATIGARPPEFSAIRSKFMQGVYFVWDPIQEYTLKFFNLFGGMPTDILVILVTLGLFALVTFVYLKLKPTIFLSNSDFVGQCPDRWIYREDDGGKCYPTYQTTCSPFDPDLYTRDRCSIAKSCGTSWKGLCN